MAYFQIEKNPKKKFFDLKVDRAQLKDEDFEQATDALISNAKEYFVFVSQAIRRNLNQAVYCMFPFLVNCGFACELLLKALNCMERVDYIKELHGKDRHSLYSLYKLLSVKTQEKIVDRFPHRSDKKENFELCLQENAQVFFELRYSTEYSELAGDIYFVPDLMITLFNIIQIDRKRED